MLTNDGMIDGKPGEILAAWRKIRDSVGTVPKEKKAGMKFETLSSENVIDKVRDAANQEGVLVYPVSTTGHGMVVEDGTLADVNVTFRVQAISDGSYIEIAGFGLGADSQDKAGGKAGTYAMKAALVQALLAGGSKKKGGVKAADTDDEDAPIAGGVKPKSAKPRALPFEEVRVLFETAVTQADYDAAVVQVRLLQPDAQLQVKDVIGPAKTRVASNALGQS